MEDDLVNKSSALLRIFRQVGQKQKQKKELKSGKKLWTSKKWEQLVPDNFQKNVLMTIFLLHLIARIRIPDGFGRRHRAFVL